MELVEWILMDEFVISSQHRECVYPFCVNIVSLIYLACDARKKDLL